MYILTLNCLDKSGIVADVATALRNADCNIEESFQFNDQLSGNFFMRVVLKSEKESAAEVFKKAFAEIARAYEMEWQLTNAKNPAKTLILVSKADHCLNDLLYRWRTRYLNIDITGIVSNHEHAQDLANSHNLPFHYLPVDEHNKPQQEQQITDIIKNTDTELIVLARYMQVFSNDMCARHNGKIINIHHSFLPGFKGAKPYHQAHERGVKIIGATAHFATADLDEGPIIEQGITRIDHTYHPKKMQKLGRDIESQTLARAIELYSERRIFLHDARTVIL